MQLCSSTHTERLCVCVLAFRINWQRLCEVWNATSYRCPLGLRTCGDVAECFCVWHCMHLYGLWIVVHVVNWCKNMCPIESAISIRMKWNVCIFSGRQSSVQSHMVCVCVWAYCWMSYGKKHITFQPRKRKVHMRLWTINERVRSWDFAYTQLIGIIIIVSNIITYIVTRVHIASILHCNILALPCAESLLAGSRIEDPDRCGKKYTTWYCCKHSLMANVMSMFASHHDRFFSGSEQTFARENDWMINYKRIYMLILLSLSLSFPH